MPATFSEAGLELEMDFPPEFLTDSEGRGVDGGTNAFQ